jgi:hypothetical protein
VTWVTWFKGVNKIINKVKNSIRGIGKPRYSRYLVTIPVIPRVLAVTWSELTTLPPSYLLEISLKFKEKGANK